MTTKKFNHIIKSRGKFMRYLDDAKVKKFLSATKNQKTMMIYNALVRGFKEEDATMSIELFNTFSFEQMGLNKSTYLKDLSTLEQLLFIQNDPITYLDGLVVLKKCYEGLGVKRNFSALINAYSQICKEREQNDTGYKLWIEDAFNAGLITKSKMTKLIKENTVDELSK